MCGRYVVQGAEGLLEDFFNCEEWPQFGDHFNITPMSWCPVVRRSPEGRRVAHLLRWGLLPHGAPADDLGAKFNNARGETVATRPTFRAAYRRRRCIVPASGFYEWQEMAGARRQPWYIRLRGDQPLAMGGLWESWTAPGGEVLRTFCVVTVGPNEIMAPIHDRMPVILKPEDWADWLDPATDGARIAGLIRPAPAGDMEAWPVSRRVGNARENGPDLILPEGVPA